MYDWILLAALFIPAYYFFHQFNQQSQVILFTLTVIGLLYHNHSRFYLFRNIPLVKNICICTCWVLLLFYTFGDIHSTFEKRLIYSVDFFFILLAQSLLFDYRDRLDDLSFGHKTFSNHFLLKSLKSVILILFVLSLILECFMVYMNWKSCWNLLSLFVIYCFYFIFLNTYLLRSGTRFPFNPDIFLVIKLSL